MLQWLRDLLKIYTLRDFWLIMTVPTAIVVTWSVFCFLLGIPNDVVRCVALWALILGLTVLGATAQASARESVERRA